MARPIHVETKVRAPLDQLWLRTQDPAQHRRWDLRFTDIVPLSSATPGPQRFRYATRVLPFLTVTGTGVHAGERRRADGGSTSALRFASLHPLSLIRDGSGYWRYLPEADGIRFVTGYDYQSRWGGAGRLLDAALFRPLMGWATAWSFDRLRIWLEYGVPPEVSRNRAVAEVAVRAAAVLMTAGGHPFLTAVVVAAAVLLPPRPTTPAARRSRRRPTTPVREPRIARTLTPQDAQ